MKHDQPNILIILSDQHAPQFSGPYGHQIVQTPHMNRIAEQGTVFENAYCNSPICVPSRMCFMTGLHVRNNGIWDNGVPLRSDTVTWAHLAKSMGYDVALSGKMHFRGPDHLHGFQAQLAYDINARNLPQIRDWSQPPPVRETPLQSIRAEAGSSKEIVADDAVETAALDYIRNPARKQQPWALVAGFVAPHPPFVAPPEYVRMYPPQDVDLPVVPDEHVSQLHPAYQRLMQWRGITEGSITEANIRQVRSVYYAQITYLDDKIGRLLAALDETGQRESTVIVYVSDHGEMLGEHGLWHKCNFYEQSARIPMLIAHPQQLPTGRRISKVVSMVDLTAALIDMMGAEPISPLDGDSLLPLLNGQADHWKDEALSEFYADGATRPWAMLRQGRYKLVYSYQEDPELYDLVNDPGEFRNLATDPSYQETLVHLTNSLLARWKPAAVDTTIRQSQRERRLIYNDLFGYLKDI